MSLEEMIKAEALSLGFALCGFSSAETPPHYETFLAWIEAGHHAGMEYMSRPNAIEARYDPAKLLPECRTVISLGVPYPMPASVNHLQANQGRIAAYAILPDYHAILKDRVEQLAQKIAQLTPQPLKHLVCVDTAPILKKTMRSSLDWAGLPGIPA